MLTGHEEEVYKQTGIVQFDAVLEEIYAQVSFHDVHWWAKNEYFAPFLKVLHFISKNETRGVAPEASNRFFFAVTNFFCEAVDFDNQKSLLTIGLMNFGKMGNNIDVEFELLSFRSLILEQTMFEVHKWGETIFIGAFIFQCQTRNETDLSVTVGCDDVKIEWSYRIFKQIEMIAREWHINQNSLSVTSKKNILVNISARNLFLLLDVCEKYYAAFFLSAVKVILEENNDAIVLKIEMVRAVHGIRGSELSLIDIFESERSMKDAQNRINRSPIKRWLFSDTKEEMIKEKNSEKENRGKQFMSVDGIRIFLHKNSMTVNKISIDVLNSVFLSWCPEVHMILFKTFVLFRTMMQNMKKTNRKIPLKVHFRLSAKNLFEVLLVLARNHQVLWKGRSLNFEIIDSEMNITSKELYIILNGENICRVLNPSVSARSQDNLMTQSRIAFVTLSSTVNKVWIWKADKFVFHLPFAFNFANVFDEFINIIKWIKMVHNIEKSEFTANTSLPSDVKIEFDELSLELEDDIFENKLKLSSLLKEDEVYESERRYQLLEDRLTNLKKTAPFLSKEMIENMKNVLIKKNSEIYIQRWKMSEISEHPLFVSSWKGFSVRAFADLSLHGTEKCLQMMKLFDPLSSLPEQKYSTLWARAVEFDTDEWSITFKDYPMKYLNIKDLRFFGTLVAAECFSDDGRSLKECIIPLPEPLPTYTIKRNISPLKFYYDLQCASSSFICSYGPCWEPCLSMISLLWNNISAPSLDPSQPLPFWDKLRFLLHGKLLWASERVITTMLASNDPYNETETVEMCWEDVGLDWALGEIRIKAGLRIFLRTASRYDDSQVLSFPDVRLKVLLGWECAGDPHDHHSVQICSPKRLPHYSSADEHDSYRQFRSACVNITLNVDVSPGSCIPVEKMPNLLLYANTFRCIEQFFKSLTTKNRNVRRGKIFGNRVLLKPQLSKHLGKLQFSFSLPKVLVSYWMSHSSSYGFRVFSDGLQLTASFRQTMQHSTVNRERNIQRRKIYTWSTHHMTGTCWATQIHVYGSELGPTTDGFPSEETFLLGFGRVQYARETYPGKDSPLHKVSAYDLKLAWTAVNRDACLTIADGVHRAHMLRRILSNDAVKTLNVHLEEAVDIKQQQQPTKTVVPKTHMRGYSVSDANPWMLCQLIDEVSTKLVAHCEQSSDVPNDSLIGVQQCTMDDVKLLNWQSEFVE
uniref:Fmp27_GFWDK domain-containing protein n=1 Tax=Caenorhabditis japonica TaxID=281687 RepID=A0A8R1HHQ7_CAEJA